jgi:LDH2 family malate/lactate/ureidoglycolate dehydrogenase
MACSNSAYERVRIYASQGRKIPSHWAIDPAGTPVEDPSIISEDAFRGGGGLIGIGDGGYKGYGLSVMVNVLSGVLNGGAYFESLAEFAPYNIPERDSFALVALNIANFMPYDQFAARMDDFVDTMKSSKRAPGVSEIFVPGEKGHRREQERRVSGVPLDLATADGLRNLARELNIPSLPGL